LRLSGRRLFIHNSSAEPQTRVSSPILRGTPHYYELKDGEFGGGNEGSRYVATAIDDNSISFEPRAKARNSFVWKRETKDSWTAILRWPANNNKPAGERIYNMERIR
jgi:hypothetical protein